jgi:hydrogenase expression/formation protein HypD
MKYLSEYRDPVIARSLVERIKARASRRWVLMEVCGGQTHTIVRQGIDELLDDAIEMIHGPGCPVCVTPLEQIDRALHLASRPDVIFTSFGDMLRVPGSDCDLLQIRARGGKVRIVYSPLDALELAIRNPDRQVVFFAVGFETTAPANAMAVWRARELDVTNFTVLVSHVTVPPAMTALLSAPDNRVQAFLAAGHVCTVMGWSEYEPIASRYRVPIIVTGFEPIDLLEGMLMAVEQLETGRHEVENQYVRSVKREGTVPARELVARVFQLVDRNWRGIGEIPLSGLGLREEFAAFDAERRFELTGIRASEPAECHAGDVLRGKMKTLMCPLLCRVC